MRRLGCAIVVLAVGIGLPALDGTAAARTPPPAAPHTRLFTAVLSLRGVEAMQALERARLLALCREDDYACLARRLNPRRRRVATLRAGPSSAAGVVGYVSAVLAVEQGMGLVVGLAVDTSDTPTRSATWIRNVGDYFYGVHVEGVRPRGEWLELSPLPLLGQAWMSAGEPDLSASVVPLVGEIRDLRPLRATFPDGTRRAIDRGSYLITKVHGRSVEFRAEVESDFDCGENRPRPRVPPPTLRATAADFFDADGTPRFRTKYVKGC
jgi:hypothetical protein